MAGAGIIRKFVGLGLKKKAIPAKQKKEFMAAKSSFKTALKKALNKAKDKVKEGDLGAKKEVKDIQFNIKKLDTLKPTILPSSLKSKQKKLKKESLDTIKDSPRKAILQAQQYKKLQSGLEKQYEKTLSAYNKIKDKKSETAMLMRNKLNDMAKKIKGKKQIPMLPEGKAQGGMPRKRTGHMDYRHGGMIIVSLDLKKKKKGK